MSEQGYRVLAVASRAIDPRAAYDKCAESALVFDGFLTFVDPPKSDAGEAIRALEDDGVTARHSYRRQRARRRQGLRATSVSIPATWCSAARSTRWPRGSRQALERATLFAG